MPRRVLTIPFLLLPLLAACSGKDASTRTTSLATTASTTAAVSPSLTSSVSPSGSTSATTPAPSPSFSAVPKRVLISIANGKIAGSDKVTMKVGETIELRIATDTAATIHAHGFEVEKKLAAGETASVFLTAKAPGSFDVEDHVTDKLVTRVLVTS